LNLIERKDKTDRMNFLFENITTIFLKIEQEAKLRSSQIMTFFKKLPIRECFLVSVIVLNLFILFFMESETKEFKMYPRMYTIQNGKIIKTILTCIVLSLCIL